MSQLFHSEIKAFIRGDQLALLSRVLSNMALHFGVPRQALPKVLYQAGLNMKQIEKQMAGVNKSASGVFKNKRSKPIKK